MMPLTFACPGKSYEIRKICGRPDIRKHLENLGFVVGGSVTPVSMVQGNLIVSVKEVRVAISKEMACKIMI